MSITAAIILTCFGALVGFVAGYNYGWNKGRVAIEAIANDWRKRFNEAELRANRAEQAVRDDIANHVKNWLDRT